MKPSNTATPLGSNPTFQKPDGVKLGIGLTSPSPELAQICGYSGFDMVLIDMEHGPISIESAYRMVTALVGTAAEAWIRVSHNDVAQIKLALDAGAKAIVVPMITTKAEAELAVSSGKYPPQGMRGWGPFRSQYQWKTNMLDYANRANAETRVLALSILADVTIDPARFINELLMIFEVNSSCKKKMPASSREKYYMSAASKSSACIAKVWA